MESVFLNCSKMKEFVRGLQYETEKDIFHAKVEAPVLPEMITQKVSNCSEIIIKRMLPL